MRTTTATILTREVIELLRSSLSDRGRSPQTVKAYTSDLTVFLEEMEKDSIGLEELETLGMRWLQMNRRKVAPKTTSRRLTSLRAYAKWIGHGELFRDYSAPTPAPPVPHPLPEGIEGVQRLIEACGANERHKVLVALCGFVGCRVAEALAIGPQDFNFEDMTVKIRGKGDKERIVPVSTNAWSILAVTVTQAACEGRDRLLDFSNRYARRVITELGEKAGLKRHISSHDLRATFATGVYDRTLDQRTVQILLGHSNGKTTETYIGRSQGQLKEAVEL